MQLAKMAAIRESETVSVVFNVPGNSYQMFVDYDNDRSLDIGDGDRQLRNITMPPGVIISDCAFGFGQNYTQFNTHGRPNLIGTLTFKNTAGTTRSVVISKMGRLRVE